jgi:hypothetical protein
MEKWSQRSLSPGDEFSTLYYLFTLYKRYYNQRNLDNFNYCLNKLFMSGKWNGQSKAEFQKNYKRVQDIVEKSAGDKDKMISLSKTQAVRITDEWKAINRAVCAKELGHEEIFEVFFQRAYELGTVSKQEYRQYKLEKLGI